MQTLLTYSFEHPPAPERIAEGLQRIERRYASLWDKAFVHSHADCGKVGMHVWDVADNGSNWPVWVEADGQSVATINVPLGWVALTGESPLGEAPLLVASQLLARPENVRELTPPFSMAHLHHATGRLTMFTDMIGMGKLFEVRCREGWVWSNRPVVACLFGGQAVRPAREGWDFLAACEWPMGDTTAYEGVNVVPAATQIHAEGHKKDASTINLLAELCAQAQGGAVTDEQLDRTADALVRTAQSVASAWPQRPTISLSGGRDSRLVAAAFVAADAEFSLSTDGRIEGEAITARSLLRALPRPVEHVIRNSGERAQQSILEQGVVERARGWHDFSEGIYPAASLMRNPPRSLVAPKYPGVSGGGGEVAHGFYYPGDVRRLANMSGQRSLEAHVATLMARITLPHGLSESARVRTEEHVRAVLAESESHGVTGPLALDWFYVTERLRRWATAARPGTVLPLLAPGFVRAAFTQSMHQRQETELHRALIARLVPQWAEVPFFRPKLAQRQGAIPQRMWDDPDRDLVTGMFIDAGTRGSAFDMSAVQDAWRRSATKESSFRDEQLLQRAIWRNVFDDHIATINGEPLSPRKPVSLELLARRSRDPWRLTRRIATWANDKPFGQRIARTSIGRSLRRRLGV